MEKICEKVASEVIIFRLEEQLLQLTGDSGKEGRRRSKGDLRRLRV